MSVLVGLPALPSATCPPAAGALGGTGLGAVCSVAGGVGSAVGSAVGFGVGSVLDGVSSWVTGGATWLLGQIGGVLSTSTAIDLGAPWFRSHYAVMVGLAGVVIVPLLLLGVLQAIYRQSAAMLLRSVLVNVPLAVLLTAVAVTLVQIGLAVTDAMCAAVSQGAGLDAGHFLGTVTTALAPAAAAQQGGAPTFVLFLGGVAVVIGAVMVWIELLLRSAAVYVAVLFLPLALAGLAWPAISHWARRLVDTLVALVLSKLVIVAVLSLAAGALAGGTGSTPSGAEGAGGGFASVLGGAALLLLAAAAPWSLFRLLPFIEAGAVGHLEGVSQRARHQVAAPLRGLADVALQAASGGSMVGATGPVGVIGTVAGGPQSGGDAGRSGAGSSPAPGPPSGVGSGGGSPASGSGGTHGGRVLDVWGPGSVPVMPPTASNEEMEAELAAMYGPPGRRATVGPDVGSSGVDAIPEMPPGVTYVATLPQATGTMKTHHLGRDRLGPVLVSGGRRTDVPNR